MTEPRSASKKKTVKPQRRVKKSTLTGKKATQAVKKLKKKVKLVAKPAVNKKTAPKATAKRKKSAETKTTTKPATKQKVSRLGRPRVTADAKLDQFFARDYQAREIFGFLNVHTVKELEEHPPAEIVERLTSPVIQTVERIRKALAMNNRYLSGDRQFAIDFQQRLKEN